MAGFTLEVTFTGLNLFVVHEDGKQVAVVQPDARLPDESQGREVEMRHEDNSEGVPHVGYLSFDLAYLGIGIPAEDPPRGEGVYLFNRQTLNFNLGNDPLDVIAPPLPEFDEFAKTLMVRPDVFGVAPAEPPVMRAMLSGGKLSGSDGDAEFIMPQVLNDPVGAEYKGNFAGDVTWSRTVSADGLRLTLHALAGAQQAEISLRPVNEFIRLKIANLCADNPLEWDGFEVDDIARDDEDFKWLYRLLRLPSGTYWDKLLGSPFPIPRYVPEGSVGVENCIGGIIRGQSFTAPPTVQR